MSKTNTNTHQRNKDVLSDTNEAGIHDKYKNHPYLIFLGMLGFFLIFIVVGAYFTQFNSSLSDSQDVWGQFGDFIGGTLNPILAFLSLLALLYTIVLQLQSLSATRTQLEISNKELQSSTQELALTRATINDQKEIQELQKQLQEVQIFDNHYFNSLDLLVNIIQLMQIKDSFTDEIHVGQYAFSKMAKLLQKELGDDIYKDINIENLKQVKPKSGFQFWSEYSSQLYGFYNLVVYILKDIESLSSSKRKPLYANKISSILSAENKYIIFGLSLLYLDEGQDLFEKYKFFEDLSLPKNFKEINKVIYPHLTKNHYV